MPKTSSALDFRSPHLIRNEAEYDHVVAEIDRLLDSRPRENSRADEYLEFLSVLVAQYDRKHYDLPGEPVNARSRTRAPRRR